MANCTGTGYRILTDCVFRRFRERDERSACYNRIAVMAAKLRVCAVSYLNTAPLVWGLCHGAQRGLFDLDFALPSVCADRLRCGETDAGLVPVIELARQPDLVVVPGSAVACQGAVRSIVLVCKKPIGEIESFAADTGSRTSVVLAQIVAAHEHGIRPTVRPYPPRLDQMLEIADAALIIGDPALRIDPAMSSWRGQPVHVYDLGTAWEEMTGLPMVFAVWAVKNLADASGLAEALSESAAYGARRIEEIARVEGARLGFETDLVSEYLTRHVRYELGARESKALNLYLRLAAELGLTEAPREIRFLPEPALSM